MFINTMNRLFLVLVALTCNQAIAQHVWFQPEKALILVTDDDYYVSEVYNISQKHDICIFDNPNTQSMKNRFIDAAERHLNDSTLYVKRFAQSFPETFKHLNALPTACETPINTSDPHTNFDVLWKFFDEYYPSFGERFGQTDLSWDKLYNQYGSEVTSETKPKQLFQKMSAMLANLYDGHVDLYPPADDFVFESDISNDREDKTAFIRSLQKSYGISPEDIGKTNEVLFQSLNLNFSIIDTYYLSDVEQSEMVTESDENVPPQAVYTWGVFQQQPQTGYIRILQELYYAGDDYLPVQYQKAEKTIDQIISYFKEKNINKLVIDVRYNVGGHDAVNHYLIRHLLDKNRVVKQQVSHYQDQWTAPKKYELTPFENSIRKESNLFPVVVLTSSFTSSSGEDLTLELKALPRVTHIGYKTDGIFADTHTRVLPNGWVYQLPFNQNLAHDGRFYESVGIPPDIEINPDKNYLNRCFIENNKDIVLDLILEKPDDSNQAKT